MYHSNDNNCWPFRYKNCARVELKGLVAKPELNGCSGVVIKELDESKRCGIKLDDGTGVNAKISNIVVLTPELKLERALAKLKEAGGREEEDDDDDDEDYSDPKDYVDELLAVGDARYELGHYDKAGKMYFRAYYATTHKAHCINCPESFPVAQKMLQAWGKSDEEHILKLAHSMAQQALRMPGCPQYILQEKKKVEKAMTRKGIEV